MVSHTAIVFTRYTLLEWIRRNENDQKTYGELFFTLCDDIQDMDLTTALKSLMALFVECLNQKPTAENTNNTKCQLINRMFKTNDTAWFRIHKDDANLMQVIYQIISSYFEDDCADELTNEPVMKAILDKDALASQPALSHFFNRMDGDTLEQLKQITRELRKVIYSIKKPEVSSG